MAARRHGFDDNIMEFAVRFADLRHSKDRGGERVKSFQQISKEIFEKTGVYISHTQLSKYENMEDGYGKLIYPKINIILAIASYYDVSVEYLMGLTDSKSNDDEYKIGSNEFGLSDTSMKFLKIAAKGRSIPFPKEYNFDLMDYVNYFITDCAPELLFGIVSFLNVLDEIKENKKDHVDFGSPDTQEIKDLTEKALAKRYALIRDFEKLLDRLCRIIDDSPKNKPTKQQFYYEMHSFFFPYIK